MHIMHFQDVDSGYNIRLFLFFFFFVALNHVILFKNLFGHNLSACLKNYKNFLLIHITVLQGKKIPHKSGKQEFSVIQWK